MSSMKKTILSAAIGLALGVTGVAAHAATVNSGDTLTITQGVPVIVGSGTSATQTNVSAGSWFAMDTTGGANVTGTMKTVIDPGTEGIIIGSLQNSGPTTAFTSTTGTVTQQLSGPGQIDTWSFFGAQGNDYTNVSGGGTPITGSTTNGLNMSGWNVYWNGAGPIPMSSGAWTPGNATALGVPTGYTFSNGVAQFSWDGVYGDSYTLNYAATVSGATGAAQGFNGVKYFLHLTGTVMKAPATVPLPAAVWLFGSGLLGLTGIARRKRNKV